MNVSRWVGLTTTIVAVAIFTQATTAAPVNPEKPPEQRENKEMPTKQEFYLKVENLVDNVEDFDVRRFTIRTLGRRGAFIRAGGGIGGRTELLPGDDPKSDVHRAEFLLITRMDMKFDKNNGLEEGYWRTVKWGREVGSSVGTFVVDGELKTLKGKINITAKSGHLEVGKTHKLGKVFDEEIEITVR